MKRCATLMVLLLVGCSYFYELEAVVRDGRVAFVPKDGDGGTGCLDDFSVSDADGRIVWHVSAPHYIPPPCESRFPIVYSVVPAGMTEKVKPAALRAGLVYTVSGSDGDAYDGSFRYRRTIEVENLGSPQR